MADNNEQDIQKAIDEKYPSISKPKTRNNEIIEALKCMIELIDNPNECGYYDSKEYPKVHLINYDNRVCKICGQSEDMINKKRLIYKNLLEILSNG